MGGFNLEALITNAKNAIVETTRNSGVSRVGSEAHPIKERFNCGPLSAARIGNAVDDAAGNYQGNLCCGARRSIDREFSHDATSPLTHPLQAEMFLPLSNDGRVNPYSIVAYNAVSGRPHRRARLEGRGARE